MNFRQRLQSVAPARETVLTIGVFDGVHLGHQHLLRRLVQLAGPSYSPAVVTFTNHPATVLRPGTSVGYITTLAQKSRLLSEQGVEVVVPLEFTPELSQVSADNFVELLVDCLNMRGLVIGPDAALGHNREGNLAFLQNKGSALGFWVEEVEPLLVDGIPVKSRRIRDAINHGEVATCARLLGHYLSISGNVIVGNRRGRTLGFPTANLRMDEDVLIPADGIYATWTTIEGVRRPSATSIGIRPTFGLTERLVEVFVMDFDSDIYGMEIGVDFVRKVRDQETFSTVEALIDQMKEDVAQSRLALEEDGGWYGA